MRTNLRLVSLCPSNTEILYTLGLLPYVVGIDNYSDWPEQELSHLERLGPDLQIDMEKVQSLKPDLAVASLSVPGMEHVVEELERRNIPHIVLSPHSLDDMFADMRTVLAACKEFVDIEMAEQTIEKLKQRVERVAAATENLSHKPSLYWEWWPNPVFSPAKDNWLTELSRLAGAKNLFEEYEGKQVKDDGTKVLSADPDYFLAVWTGIPQQKVPLPKIKARTGWSNLRAFADNHFFILSEGLFCRPSPRLVDGLEQLLSLIHPNLAKQLELPPAESYGPVRTWDGAWLGDVLP